MFKTKIEVCGHQYIVRSKFSEYGPDATERADIFESFEDLINHLRCRLPIFPPLSVNSVPPFQPSKG